MGRCFGNKETTLNCLRGIFLLLAGTTTVKKLRESSFDILPTSLLNRLNVELLKDLSACVMHGPHAVNWRFNSFHPRLQLQ